MPDSTPLAERVTALGHDMAFPLTDRDVERLVKRTRRRARQRRTRHLALISLTGALCIGSGLWWAVTQVHSRGATRMASIGSPPPPSGMGSSRVSPTRLRDGSVLRPLNDETRLAVLKETPHHIVVDLQRGRTRVEVVPNVERSFEVRAGDVIVRVMGTIFTVERVADRVGVTVERGTVQVDWGVGRQELHVAEGGWFPPLQVRPQAPANDRVDELLRAADAARIAGRSEDAATLLDRAVRKWPDDPQAPLAAFTLGRVLLFELRRPAPAATAFATARALAPTGSFAEDAMAREVEAWSIAGERATARRRARDYLRAYPRGRRVDEVSAFGGLR